MAAVPGLRFPRLTAIRAYAPERLSAAVMARQGISSLPAMGSQPLSSSCASQYHTALTRCSIDSKRGSTCCDSACSSAGAALEAGGRQDDAKRRLSLSRALSVWS